MMKVCSRCNIEKEESEFRHRKSKCWECVKEAVRLYRKSDKYLKQQVEYKLKNKQKIKQQTKKRVAIKGKNLSDRYVIEQLLNVNVNKVGYTTEFLKSHPDIIENKRIEILKNRLLKLIKGVEGIANIGVCTRCKKSVPLSEFRFQKRTERKRAHLQRWCKSCKKEYNKKYWQNKKNEKHNNS